MKCLSALSNAPLRRIALHCCVLLTVTGGAALAQTTGTVNPGPAPAEPAAKADVPLGGCMPIGLTASGEIVFPIQCKEFIDRERSKAAVEQTPRAAGGKPALADDKPGVAEQKPAVADEKPAAAEPKPAMVEERPADAEPKPAVVEEKPAPRQLEAVAPPQDAASAIGKPAESRLKPRPRQSASTVRQANAPPVPTAVPTSGLMMRHLDPTGAMMDGAIPADRPGRLCAPRCSRALRANTLAAAGCHTDTKL